MHDYLQYTGGNMWDLPYPPLCTRKIFAYPNSRSNLCKVYKKVMLLHGDCNLMHRFKFLLWAPQNAHILK